ncbi:MAG: hypothetical protein ACP5NV_01475 [Candidatus Woesearchaeota archaeon]
MKKTTLTGIVINGIIGIGIVIASTGCDYIREIQKIDIQKREIHPYNLLDTDNDGKKEAIIEGEFYPSGHGLYASNSWWIEGGKYYMNRFELPKFITGIEPISNFENAKRTVDICTEKNNVPTIIVTDTYKKKLK